MPTGIGSVNMTTEPALLLREIVEKLGRIRNLPAGKPPIRELLGFLKAGDLKAGIEFPGASKTWVPIPQSYWMGITTDKFKSLKQKGREGRNGTYVVRIQEFVNDYKEAVSQQIKSKPEALTAALRELTAAVSV